MNSKWTNVDYAKVRDIKRGLAYKRYKRTVRVPFIVSLVCIPLLIILSGWLQYLVLGVLIASLIVYLVLNAKAWKCPKCGALLPHQHNGGPTILLVSNCPYCGEDLTKQEV